LSLFVPKGSNPVLEILSSSGIDVHRSAGGEDRQKEKCQVEQIGASYGFSSVAERDAELHPAAFGPILIHLVLEEVDLIKHIPFFEALHAAEH
jgi:hypothetical protein